MKSIQEKLSKNDYKAAAEIYQSIDELEMQQIFISKQKNLILLQESLNPWATSKRQRNTTENPVIIQRQGKYS